MKPSRPEKWPSWKIHTIAPNVAVRLSTLSSSALTGTSRLPVIRNSRTNVASAMIPSVHGRTRSTDSFVSTSVADSPVTVNANGAVVARMSFTSCSPAAECGSMSGTTESQVPRLAGVRLEPVAQLVRAAATTTCPFGPQVVAGARVDPRRRRGARRACARTRRSRPCRSCRSAVGREHLERVGLAAREVLADLVGRRPGSRRGRAPPGRR